MVHPEPTQRPEACVASRHVDTVAMVPSALHTLRVFDDTHIAARGVHTVDPTQAPDTHVCPVAQAVGVWPSPSALHT